MIPSYHFVLAGVEQVHMTADLLIVLKLPKVADILRICKQFTLFYNITAKILRFFIRWQDMLLNELGIVFFQYYQSALFIYIVSIII